MSKFHKEYTNSFRTFSQLYFCGKCFPHVREIFSKISSILAVQEKAREKVFWEISAEGNIQNLTLKIY